MVMLTERCTFNYISSHWFGKCVCIIRVQLQKNILRRSVKGKAESHVCINVCVFVPHRAGVFEQRIAALAGK